MQLEDETEEASDGPLRGWLDTPVPEKLWHYTSLKGFHGIVLSKQIFATDLRFLNDRDEFVHARNLADLVISEATERGRGSPREGKTLLKIVASAFDNYFELDQLQLFVCSFSASEDQLSQWRGYSRGSAGVSLGFDLTALRPALHKTGSMVFAPCVYSQEKKKQLMEHTLYRFTRTSTHNLEEAIKGYKKDLSLARQARPSMAEEQVKHEVCSHEPTQCKSTRSPTPRCLVDRCCSSQPC